MTPRRGHTRAGNQRIEELAGSANGSRPRIIEAGGVQLDVGGIRMKTDGRVIDLPLQEYKILRLLMEQAGTVLSRRFILDNAWEPGYPDENKTLEVHVSRLRKKMERPDGICPLRTIRNFGYVFDSDDSWPVQTSRPSEGRPSRVTRYTHRPG